MSKPIIEIRKVGKRYRIGGLRQQDGLRHAITGWISSPIKKWRESGQKEEFWALKDISIDLEQGDILGVIGRNGAGKSTLLKILSRITEPTEGEIVLRGHVASLLEVGTGFHAELTGRENIFMNGAILGMTRAEIRKKFDAIVAFSEVEKFLETPVKRYSSGMTVRLAFAVAAHLDPEILVIDEVLAVGDIAFQKKCLGKMSEIAKGGRTVLFVSHNMAAINSLCNKGMLLSRGKIEEVGHKDIVIAKYLERIIEISKGDFSDRLDRQGNGRLRFVSYSLEDEKGKPASVFRSGGKAIIAVRYQSADGKPIENVVVDFGVQDPLGNRITVLSNKLTSGEWSQIPPRGIIRCCIPRLPFKPGTYTFTIFSRVNSFIADWINDAGQFLVEAGSFYESGRLTEDSSFVLVDNYWDVREE